MAIAFVAAGTTATTTTTNSTTGALVTVNLPTGYSIGDALIYIVSTNTNVNGFPSTSNSGPAYIGTGLAVYWRIADGSANDSLPDLLFFANTGTTATVRCQVFAYSGTSRINIVRNSAVITNSTTTSSATAAFALSSPTSWIISIYGNRTVNTTFTAPASTTTRSNVGTAPGNLIVDEASAGGPTSTARTATCTPAAFTGNIAVELVPYGTPLLLGDATTKTAATSITITNTGNAYPSAPSASLNVAIFVAFTNTFSTSSTAYTVTGTGLSFAVLTALNPTGSPGAFIFNDYTVTDLTQNVTITCTGSNTFYVAHMWAIEGVTQANLISIVSSTSTGGLTSPTVTASTLNATDKIMLGSIVQNGPTTDTFTPATTWGSAPGRGGSSGSGAASNYVAFFAHTISSATSVTFNPTVTARSNQTISTFGYYLTKPPVARGNFFRLF